jgi:predicted nuclease of predicted toxin-antitoxin system
MTRFLADEDFNNDILRGLLRRVARVDVVRVQDIGLRGASDDAVLAGAAEAGRVLLTHDSSTLIGRAFARTVQGAQMPGVLLVECSSSEEWNDQVRYLPLR